MEPKELSEEQKQKIKEFLLSDEGTPADETPGDSIKKLLNLSDEEYAELDAAIDECISEFFEDFD